MKIGLEQEFFLVEASNMDVPVVVPRDAGLPFDDCGLLIEARGEPHDDAINAVFSLQADIYRIAEILKSYNSRKGKSLVMVSTPVMKVPRKTEQAARRDYAKGVVSYENIYGYESHKNARNEMTAGIHISFTKPVTVGGENKRTVNQMFDWLKVFKQLDKSFGTEIKDSRRVGGMYELKHDGRIEYRSLPTNASHDKIIEVLKNVQNKIGLLYVVNNQEDGRCTLL